MLCCGVAAIAYLWLVFFGKLHNLMKGSRSVRAFSLKLLLVRRWFLEGFKVQNYRIVFCEEQEDTRSADESHE